MIMTEYVLSVSSVRIMGLRYALISYFSNLIDHLYLKFTVSRSNASGTLQMSLQIQHLESFALD